MNSEKTIVEPDILNCEICLREIPASEAQSAEAQDYVAHFCGLECYEQWRAREKEKAHPEATD